MVVVGYAVGNKRSISGAVERVTAEEMNTGYVASAIDAIRGKIPGLVISRTGGSTDSPTVRLRGTTSLSGGSDPLVIIDGSFSSLEALDEIASQDIEEISVLKGASERAQYGSRGAAGVIVVNTKKGEQGRASISYQGQFGVSTAYKQLEMLSADVAEDYSQADPRWDKSFFYGAFTIDGKEPGSGIAGSPYTRGNYLAYQGQLHMQFSTDLAANAQNPDWANYIVRWSGCRPKKPEVDKTDVHTQFSYYSNADIVVYRMADMILLAAEAYYRLGDSGKALDLINKVRGRVGAEGRTSLSIKDISDERALELMWEPTRREDQIRFGTYAEPTVDKNENTACAAISAGDWSGKAGWYKDTEGTTLVFPIPQSVLELNKNLKQNYGYTL